MQSIKAHIYNTQLEAETSIDLINSTLGIPISVDAVTQTYTNFEFNNGKYIIKSDETTISILGASQDFDYLNESIL